MWESIKNFFKWIADRRGISWIARKISSGWNWLFSSKANTAQENISPKRPSDENVNKSPTVSTPMQNETEEPVSKTGTNVEPAENFPEKSEQPRRHVNPNKPNVIQQSTKPGSYFEFIDKKLLFVTTNENYKRLEEKCKNEDKNGKVIPGEFRIFVECESNKFCITGPYSSCQDVDDGKKSVSITSVKKQHDKGTISKDPSEMMYKVGLDENKNLAEITRMSINPLKTTTPNLNATTIQRTVNNDSETTTTDQQRALSQEVVANEPKGVGYIELDKDNYLFLNVEKGIKVEDYKYSLTQDKFSPQLLVYLRCGKGEYRITGISHLHGVSECVLVQSVLKKKEDGNYIDDDKILVQDNIEHVKEMLGLKDDVTEIKIDNISNQPFEGTALEQHNLNPTTAQQMVNNKEVTTESEEFYDEEVTQPSPTIGVPSTERNYVTNPSVD
ncbi:hypothetical protein [Wolbachia endosymbiont (group B) of Episyrphus balteatus]|uniref:hypothetical protein n=1 Tax=Wolbachia endosymbiont (group B) of Episyrphus balteatus TaxID=2954009 RepID=UPI002227A352|nr:hypothetical protein [Wolbachia endosymbiont (group B) of Episyrphus balteatus]